MCILHKSAVLPQITMTGCERMAQGMNEYNAWLQPGNLPTVTACVDGEGIAAEECREGLTRLYGDKCLTSGGAYAVKLLQDNTMAAEGFALKGTSGGITIKGADDNGLLYGVFAFLMRLAAGAKWEDIDEAQAPAVSRRILNHWDNITGTIERGYAGSSIFFKDGKLDYDTKRLRDYARLLASVGINQIAVNNVNVTPQSARLMTEELLPEVKALSDIFRPYGIKLILTVDYESPETIGGLKTSDPLDADVIDWWRNQTEVVYRYIPDLAGYLVKADSEFRNGPAALGRTQADGANVLARALKPYNGVVYWRCFIYNCDQDWRDTVTDRPKAAYDQFKPLDGAFDDNVILQIKHGPTDFQVREPNSPLLGAMPKTRQAIEFQITQEYTGQQIDLYALPVQWEEIFNTHVDENRRTRDLIGKELDAVCAVANVGRDINWTGHTLAQLNLFGYGRMAWNPKLTAKEIISEWVSLTFGNNPEMHGKLSQMLFDSRGVYEKYNAPLGIGWMVNIHHHYGPSVDGYEYMRWGTYHRADHTAIGIDRTSKGTGFTTQYSPWLAAKYDSIDTCPEEMLLFFHRLPYTFRLRSGKTLLQHIYDTHFEGVNDVEHFIASWDSLRELLPEAAHRSVAERLKRQLANAREWRDVVNSYFCRKTGIPDEKGRKIYT